MRIRLLILLLSFGSPLIAQQRPFVTEQASTVGGGNFRFELGFEFLQEAVFPLSGLSGDLSEVGVIGARFGIGEKVEFQILGTAYRFLNIDSQVDAPITPDLDFTGNSTGDIGDFTLASKFRFNSESGKVPVISFRFGVQLPNTSTESGVGTDETNVFMEFLIEKHLGDFQMVGNVGFAILGDPLLAGSQDDHVTYAFSTVYQLTPAVGIGAEIYGRAGDGGIGTEEQSRVRAGARFSAGGLYWDVAGFWGLLDTDPAYGVIVGLTKTFDLSP